jgi:ABC-type transporter Mla MlaB component
MAHVTVRITVITDRPRLRLRVEGRLSRDEVGELEQLIADDPGTTCLDLASLHSADAAGLALLRRLLAEGATFAGVPPHLALRIEQGGR